MKQNKTKTNMNTCSEVEIEILLAEARALLAEARAVYGRFPIADIPEGMPNVSTPPLTDHPDLPPLTVDSI